MKISHDDQSSKEIFYGKWHRKSQDKNMHFVEHWFWKDVPFLKMVPGIILHSPTEASCVV